MKYKKFLLVIPLAVFSLVVSYIAPITSNAATKVKVLQYTPLGDVGIEDIPSTTMVLPAVSIPQCQSQVEIDRYGRGVYEANFSKTAVCLSGQMSATVLNQQISGIEDSINAIDDRLLRIKEAATYLQIFSATNVNGLSLTVIPAGELSQETNKLANGIKAQCLINSNQTTGGIVSGVGTSGNFKNSFFDTAPPKALKALKTTLEKNREINKMIAAANELVGNPLEPRGMGLFDQEEMVRNALKLEKLMSENFIPVIEKYQGEENYISSSIAIIPNEDGERQILDLTGAGWDALRLLLILVVTLPKSLTHMTFDSSVSLNGVVNGVKEIKKEQVNYMMFMPEARMFNKLTDSISEHIKNYDSMKISLNRQKNALMINLNKLVVNNYNCQ